MRRKSFDALMVATGLALAAVLLIASGLLAWGHSFVNSEVHNQLAAEKIFFPAKGSPALASPLIKPYLTPYAGQQMVNGQQAEVWADHFIAVHLLTIGGGKTYAQLSAESLAQPKNLVLAAQVNTVFKGETLRGLLLNAYAFWKMGQLMLIGAIVALGGAIAMLILSVMGIAHLRRTSPEAEVFPRITSREPVRVTEPVTAGEPVTVA
jgi:hypothetical protein